MNGKNKRVKGSWSRGQTRGSAYSKPIKIKKPNYILPNFSSQLKNSVNNNQLNLINFFENYPINKYQESFKYNTNTPYSCINLKNSDFINGTVRLTVPGVYRLISNIEFNPNESNDFFPTEQQIKSGLYTQPYKLGFFAAITIESKDIILDFNGYTIKQSKKHSFQQRFFSIIELASSPFFKKQGPANFNENTQYRSANKLLIKNGKMGLSSHHSIHGNDVKNVILQNLYITNFEVAGIHINGGTNMIIDNVKIENNNNKILVNSTYSHSRFIRPFLNAAVETSPTLKLGTKTISQINNALNDELNKTYKQFVNTGTVPNNFFKNTCSQEPCEYDGNVYGMVLNVVGVAVNDFLKERPSEDKNPGNKDIFINKLVINNISSTPVEIIALNATPNTGDNAYGGRVQVGSTGDVLNIEEIQDSEGKYKGTKLSDAQIILAKPSYTGPKGTNNITQEVVDWAEGKEPNETISNFVKSDGKFYYVGGGDSMNHIMKGNIGLFISGGLNIKGQNITINNIQSNGNKVGVSTLTPIKWREDKKKGLNSYSLLLTASKNIQITNSQNRIQQAYSEFGKSFKINIINTNNPNTIVIL